MSARPSLDPELAELLTSLPDLPALSAETLPLMRPYASTPVEPLLAARDVVRREETIVGRDGAPLPLTVISPRVASHTRPCVLWLHGGGMVMGDRFSQ
ncbi:MAG: alpha/beta hydrolase, partial [Microbacterium sp.]|nr:alpha/beta hydrolase [Microbacterium sp.]